MGTKINIADLLKECPAGTPLWSPVCGECAFSHIRPDMVNNISVKTTTKIGGLLIFSFSEHGEISCELNGECLLFPSKDHQTWEDWEVYKHKIIQSKPANYSEACYQLGIKVEESPSTWDKLHILGKAWGAMPCSYFKETETITAFVPKIESDEDTGYVVVDPECCAPAMFEDKNLAIAFRNKFDYLYLKLYNE